MAENKIYRFCENDIGTNLLSDVEYLDDAQRKIGNQPGIARSKFVNKVLKQNNAVAAGVAEFLAGRGGQDVSDADAPADFALKLENTVLKFGRSQVASAGGEANALTAKFDEPVRFSNGEIIQVRAALPNTSAATLLIEQGEAPKARAIFKNNNKALEKGDIAGLGHWLELCFDSTLDAWNLLNPAAPENIDRQYVINLIYPVGSILTSIKQDYNPNTHFAGTTWEQLPSGLFLQIADPQFENLGDFVEAGLPNIYGTMLYRAATGGLYSFFNLGKLSDPPAGGGDGGGSTFFQASGSGNSQLYGASDTVQPPAIKVSMWKRTA